MNNYDGSKDKPKRRTHQSPIDFVIPLQLEEITHAVEQRLLNSTTVRIAILPKVDAEQPEFEINLFQPLEVPLPPNARWARRWHNRDELISARGYMQRWEGTLTRFQGTAAMPYIDHYVLMCIGLSYLNLTALLLISPKLPVLEANIGLVSVLVVPLPVVVGSFYYQLRKVVNRRRLSNAVKQALVEVYSGHTQRQA
jgi:hypothetical protein